MAPSKNPRYSDIDTINRYYKANVFEVNQTTGEISLNKNLPENTKQTWRDIGEKLGVREGEVVAEALPQSNTQTQSSLSSTASSGGSSVSSVSSSSGSSGSSTQRWSWTYTGKNIRASDYAPVNVSKEDIIENPKEAERILNLNTYGGVYKVEKKGDVVTIQETVQTNPSLSKEVVDKYKTDNSVTLKPVGVEDYRLNIKNQYLQGFNYVQKIAPLNYMPGEVANFIAEGGSQFYVGLEEIRGGIDKNMAHPNVFFDDKINKPLNQSDLLFRGVSRVTTTGLYAFGTGAGIGTIGGAGIGIASGGPLAVAGTNALMTSMKGGAILTGFEGVGLMIQGKDFTEALTLENYASNVVLSAGIQTLSLPIATDISLQGYGLKTTKTLIGATTGGIAGGIFSYKYHEPEEGFKYVGAGAVIGGAFGLADAVLEEKHIKLVAGTVETRTVNTKTGVATDNFRGIKIGFEHLKVTDEVVEPRFYGATITKEGAYIGTGTKLHGITYGKIDIPSNEVVIPKGMLEMNLYGGKGTYRMAFEDFTRDYFGYTEINHDIVKGEIIRTAKGDADLLVSSAKKSGGVFGGSVVERGVGDKININPRFVKGASNDLDIVFYSDNSFKEFVKQTGVTLKPAKTGITSVENLFIDKFAGTTAAGTKLDITVIHPSIAMPKPPSPMSQYYSLGSFQKSNIMTTYSAQQQLGTKFMTVGAGTTGEIKLVEPSKTKYLYDVASMGSKSLQETQQKANNYLQDVSSAVSIKTPSFKAPSGSISQISKEISNQLPKQSTISNVLEGSIHLSSLSVSKSDISKSLSKSLSSSFSGFSSSSFSFSEGSGSSSGKSKSGGSSSITSITSSMSSGGSSSMNNINFNFKIDIPKPEPPFIPLNRNMNMGGFGKGLGTFKVDADLQSLLKPTLKMAGIGSQGRGKTKKRGKK